MIKTIITGLLIVCSLLLHFISYGQTTILYTVDPTISSEVDENIKAVSFPVTSAINFTTVAGGNTNTDSSSITSGAITKATINRDTVLLASILMATDASLGYKIIFTNDSCSVKYFSLTDKNTLKANKNDKPNHLIYVDCTIAKLTLSQKPVAKTGQLIEGMIDLITNDFWSENKNAEDSKIRMHIKGYFKTTLIQAQPGEKDIFSILQ